MVGFLLDAEVDGEDCGCSHPLVPIYLRMTGVECDHRNVNTNSNDLLLGMCIDPYRIDYGMCINSYRLMLNAYVFYHSMNLRYSA